MSNTNDHKPAADGQEKDSTIIVNGRPKKWEGETISFEEVARLAFPDAPPNNLIYTVTFKKGHEQGSMVAGDRIPVKPGTIFNVTATNRS